MVIVESLEYINICTGDLKKSIEFYTLFLDFEIIEETESYAIVAFDEIKLKIINREVKNSDNKTPLFSFVLDVDDFTDAIQSVEEEKITIVSGPDDFESGAGESLIIQDPGGNLIEFFYRE